MLSRVQQNHPSSDVKFFILSDLYSPNSFIYGHRGMLRDLQLHQKQTLTSRCPLGLEIKSIPEEFRRASLQIKVLGTFSPNGFLPPTPAPLVSSIRDDVHENNVVFESFRINSFKLSNNCEFSLQLYTHKHF